MPTHVLYIDDSGTKEYAEKSTDYNLSRRGKTRYFVFCGVLLTTAEAGRLSNTLIQLKLDCFGEEAVEIKSNWLRIPYERRGHYLDPYGISEARLTEFMDKYYDAINASEAVLIAAVINKQHMQETYPKPHYAPAVAYELVMQRVQNELPTQSVAVIIDDMSGATPKGNQYKDNLKAQHRRLIKYGSSLRKGVNFPCLSSQKFVNSASSQIIQVADVAAYNVYRQFIDHGEEWEQSGLGTLSMYEHFERMSGKFRRDANGRVQGYGIVKFPLRNRVYWGIIK